MEKKNYYTPEVRFHLLRTTEMIAESGQAEGKQGSDDEELSKGFGSFYFDEDED
jgi:hypothetical protein